MMFPYIPYPASPDPHSGSRSVIMAVRRHIIQPERNIAPFHPGQRRFRQKGIRRENSVLKFSLKPLGGFLLSDPKWQNETGKICIFNPFVQNRILSAVSALHSRGEPFRFQRRAAVFADRLPVPLLLFLCIYAVTVWTVHPSPFRIIYHISTAVSALENHGFYLLKCLEQSE